MCIRDSFQPNALVEQLKRHGPEWLEQFPQVPQLIFQGLERLQSSDRIAHKSRVVVEMDKPKSRIKTWAGSALIGIGLGVAFPHWAESAQQMPISSLILAGLGITLLLLR